MAKPNISAERLRALVDFDQTTGQFIRKVSRRGPKTESNVIGTPSKEGYLFAMLDGKNYGLHRLAWFYVHGVWHGGEIDHINGVKSDNRIDNLRAVDKFLNQQNRRSASRNSRSGFLGVHWCRCRKKWRATISVDGRNKSLGRFETPEAAYAAYVEAKRKFHIGGTI